MSVERHIFLWILIHICVWREDMRPMDIQTQWYPMSVCSGAWLYVTKFITCNEKWPLTRFICYNVSTKNIKFEVGKDLLSGCCRAWSNLYKPKTHEKGYILYGLRLSLDVASINLSCVVIVLDRIFGMSSNTTISLCTILTIFPP